ncbi:Hsp20/alpha crystallin family protein [Pullulanibacillus sp. KACC 23026]|uniref:Hsp20/alpha crystallin family protein n=1 Tax=Pullulanibacillus sp. KACC 23026 TaxID=3028315 RepID=UPI0023B017A8|nr:Hsp20/alpha crystallin family protein [Pullulanibacillus sp. KACC 23026]WEG13045.1 Hsp20/alpha crystallin family protein [Pullulanibacillus sp. KACC 23026]
MAEREENNRPVPRQPQPGPPMNPFSGGILGRIDEFFINEEYRGVLDSIDAFFQNHPFNTGRSFPVDLYETKDEWVVKAELPGVKKSQIHIETLGDRIRLAVINDERFIDQSASNYYRRERRLQQAERTIPLPYRVYRSKTKARFRDGILEIRGPKYPKTQNTIDIDDE